MFECPPVPEPEGAAREQSSHTRAHMCEHAHACTHVF